MAADVADVPGGRWAAARELRDDVGLGDERQLHAAVALGLVVAEEPALVKQLLVLGKQHARVLALLRALGERRHDVAGAAHRLLVRDVREAHRKNGVRSTFLDTRSFWPTVRKSCSDPIFSPRGFRRRAAADRPALRSRSRSAVRSSGSRTGGIAAADR